MERATAPARPRFAMSLRSWHANISAFIAPMVVFYALSGALQIFGFQQSHGSYAAPAALAAIGSLHKDQVLHEPARRAPALGAMPGAAKQSGPPERPAPALNTLLLKWLFFFEGLGLATTTILGAWIGLTHAKRKRTIVMLLVAGTLVPLALIVL